MSSRATARLSGVSKNTVAKLLQDAGKACAAYQDEALRGLTCGRIEVDEIWSFVYAKAKNVPRAKNAPPEAGDVWTWVAIDADTKLVPTWRIGDRTGMTAIDLMDDLRARVENRVQLTTDGVLRPAPLAPGTGAAVPTPCPRSRGGRPRRTQPRWPAPRGGYRILPAPASRRPTPLPACPPPQPNVVLHLAGHVRAPPDLKSRLKIGAGVEIEAEPQRL